jgi:nucleoside-diphosphate-sugar epimerase
VTRLSNEVGWQPKFNLEMGLKQAIIWWEHSNYTGLKIE